MKALTRTVYKKLDSKWVETYYSEDQERINEMLIGDFIAKYLWESPAYKKVYRQPYNGIAKITFYEQFESCKIKVEYKVKEG